MTSEQLEQDRAQDEMRLIIAAQVLAALAPQALEFDLHRRCMVAIPTDHEAAAARAAWAFTQANALLAENELHAKARAKFFPDGEEIDPRAEKPRCTHGVPFTEECTLCATAEWPPGVGKNGENGDGGSGAPN